MRRSVWIFLASILLPSLVLAWMAVRSAKDQQVVLEHQQVIISQNITDSLAGKIQAQMDQERAGFVAATQQLLAASPSPQALAEDFNRRLREAWPMAEIGFAVNPDGEIYSPKREDSPNARTFRLDNDSFLSNRENAEVYSNNVSRNFALTDENATPNAPTSRFAQIYDLHAATNALFGRENQADQGKILATAEAMKSTAGKQAVAQVPPAASAPTLAPLQNASNQMANSDDLVPRAEAGNQSRIVEEQASTVQAALSGSTEKSFRRAGALADKEAPEGSSSDRLRTGNDADMSAGTAASSLQVPSGGPGSGTAAPSGLAANFNLLSPAPQAALGGEPAPETNAAAAAAPPPAPAQAQPMEKVLRQVVPQKMLNNDDETVSNTVPQASDFRQLIGAQTSGSLARFLENKLRLMVWSHPAGTAIIFGAQLDQARLVTVLATIFQDPSLLPPDGSTSFGERARPSYCLAILDDTGQPVARSLPGFTADWKRPFVATEIGEALPHWEAALYLVDPRQFTRAAHTLQLTLGLIALVLVAAIVSGGSLVAADVRRQMRLAQQKTDFVSNVSHELKTPLTSIRMFADLLADKRVPDEERQATYLRIISAEAARLTRLINNVLDFARLERGAPPGEHHDCDLVDAARDVAETCRPHLEAAGVAFLCEVEADALPIRGDRDALAQIILNLVSNAEKYGGGDVLVRVRRQETSSGALGCVDVLDRGPGIPADKVRSVFEPFQRLDDSLAGGVPGTGLGLTLARRMARSHGGEVTYSARAGGGSCFTLAVPLRPAKSPG
jgi:signal transduction histidine kinase